MCECMKELEILDAVINFKAKEIPDSTRFWMIRTQKGYFYNEFLAKDFVAIAWNNIDKMTDLSEQGKEFLKDDIMMKFSEISRPSTVINKCNNFINEVKEGDVLVIPSKGSKFITFALAGEYFEEESKTVELEKMVISRIQNGEVDINDVSCPYKKRRKITHLRTVESENINASLYRAISNYHGISNLDEYAYHILNTLYNCYTYDKNAVLVYNIKKKTSVKPRELSQLIYGNTECLSMIIDEEYLSTQMSLHSPGDAVYTLKDAFTWACENWQTLIGLLVVVGGGSALSFKVPGIIDIIRQVLLLGEDVRSKKLDNNIKENEIYLKRVELYERIKSSGIDPKMLLNPLDAISKSCTTLETEPIVLGISEGVTMSKKIKDMKFLEEENE